MSVSIKPLQGDRAQSAEGKAYSAGREQEETTAKQVSPISVENLFMAISSGLNIQTPYYEGLCVVDADHERQFIGGSGRSQILDPSSGLELDLQG